MGNRPTPVYGCPQRIACGDGSVRRVAEVDDAEAIAVGVREHNEVRVVGIAVPVDSFCPDSHEALRLGCLLGRTGYMEG